MPSSIFLPLLRELASTYQAFEVYSAVHIRSLDLTPPQFDIVATLGNTPGMPLKELGEKTLITKGTLTGVVDRLADKGLVRRTASLSDGRSPIVPGRTGRNNRRPAPPARGVCRRARLGRGDAMTTATRYTGTAISLHCLAALPIFA